LWGNEDKTIKNIVIGKVVEMNNRKIVTRIVGDEVSETYIAEAEDEKMEISYHYDCVKNVSWLSIRWKYDGEVPRSMVEIIRQEVGGKESVARREAKRILRSKIFTKIDLMDSRRIIFNFYEEASVLMRFLREAKSFEELVAVVIGAAIAGESGDKRFEKALLDGNPAPPYKYSYYHYYFKNYLLDVSSRYRAKYSRGLFWKVEGEEGESLLKLSSRLRGLKKIVTIPYHDGWANLEMTRVELKVRDEEEIVIEVNLPNSAETVRISPEDEQHLISAFSSLASLQEAETFIKMLNLITRFHNMESWGRYQRYPPMKIFGGDPKNTLKKAIKKYIDLLGKYPNHLEKIPFYQEYPKELASEIKKETRSWKNIASFVKKYGSRGDLRKYIHTIMSLAIRVEDTETLKEILSRLPQKYQDLVKSALIMDSMTRKRRRKHTLL